MRGHFDIVARMAYERHGRVSRRQLLAAGVDPKRIDRWVAERLLRPAHDGVYAVGHAAPSVLGDYMAAVLAFRAGAVLSHRAAAYALELLRGTPPPPQVTVPTTAGLVRPGIVVHRVHTLHPLDHAVLDGIPITTVPRILLDLARTTRPKDLTRLCHEAWVRHDCGPDRIEACLARNPHKPGAAKLRRALGSDVTLSFLEDAFLALLTTHDLPLPRTNININDDKVDCHWPQLGLTIELVTYRYHGTRHGFENDIARQRRSNHLAYTYGDVIERGAATAAELRPLLTADLYDSACAPS
jgi:hypothetical protein